MLVAIRCFYKNLCLFFRIRFPNQCFNFLDACQMFSAQGRFKIFGSFLILFKSSYLNDNINTFVFLKHS